MIPVIGWAVSGTDNKGRAYSVADSRDQFLWTIAGKQLGRFSHAQLAGKRVKAGYLAFSAGGAGEMGGVSGASGSRPREWLPLDPMG
jgi:hypothetical protein